LRSAHHRSSAEEKQQRVAELKKRRPVMNENQFHAKDTC
jgi:hypothetical protein